MAASEGEGGGFCEWAKEKKKKTNNEDKGKEMNQFPLLLQALVISREDWKGGHKRM